MKTHLFRSWLITNNDINEKKSKYHVKQQNRMHQIQIRSADVPPTACITSIDRMPKSKRHGAKMQSTNDFMAEEAFLPASMICRLWDVVYLGARLFRFMYSLSVSKESSAVFSNRYFVPGWWCLRDNKHKSFLHQHGGTGMTSPPGHSISEI